AIDWVRLIEDCQLGIMGLANFMWEGAGAHGMSEGSVTVRVREQELSWGRKMKVAKLGGRFCLRVVRAGV
nr:hypothetical protein [Tanacetum cinerariifolium]